jgi:hypothetical protein
MYPVVNQNQTDHSFWEQFSKLPETIESKLPTLDKSLDAYFDRNFVSIIEEWELVTESDLNRLENRLAGVTNEISALYAEKMVLEKRAGSLDDQISSMERLV